MASNNKPDRQGDFSSNGYNRGVDRSDGKRVSDRRPDPDEIDLIKMFFTLWKSRWIIISSLILFSLLAGIISYAVTPIYRSEGSILIIQQQNSFSPGDSELGSLLASTYGVGIGSTLANELLVLESRNISLVLADSVMHKRLMANGRQFPLVFKNFPDDSALAIRDTVAMRLRENITFTRVDRESDMVKIAFESPSPVEAAYIVNLSMDVYTDFSTRQNRQSASSAVTFLENERQHIEKRLAVVEEKLREFMNEEQLVQLDAQTSEMINRTATLEGQRQEARVKLVALNSAIVQYQDRLNNIKPGLTEQYADAIGPNMVRLQYQLAELKTEKMQLITNNPSIQELATPPQKLKSLNQQITAYQNQIRKLTKKLIEDGDQYLGFLGASDGNIAQAVTELNQKLIELQVEQQQNKAQIEVIDEQLETQQAFFEDLPDNMIQLARLKRDVTISEELFLTVSKQYAEMALWEETQFGKGRIIDAGYIPEEPLKPKKRLYVLIGFILGGILSMGFILVREAFNTTIDGVEKLDKFNIPLLAVIPEMDSYLKNKHEGKKRVAYGSVNVRTTLVTLLDTLSPFAESFRRLQNNIMYSNPDRKLNSILVTSSTKGEGKTTTAANLGVVLAEAGFKTLLLDTDLRRPNMHKTFDSDRTPGLMDVLFGDVETSEAIRKTPVEQLFMLASGKGIPNPAAVMQSKRFLELLRKFEQEFDIVLIDSSPFGIITDISALIKEVDAVLVVARFASTKQGELQHTLQNLEYLNADLIGLVLTAFDAKKSKDYSYSSSYYQSAFEDYLSYHEK